MWKRLRRRKDDKNNSRQHEQDRHQVVDERVRLDPTEASSAAISHPPSSAVSHRSSSVPRRDGALSFKEHPTLSNSSVEGGQIDPLGLHVLHAPTNGHAIDIVFIHGLGGKSQRSWCYNRDLRYFWPRDWLPQEPGITNARLLSFGYDADFRSTGSGTVSAISDFAAHLLWDMKLGRDQNDEPFDMGKVPIILVAHSMGGLVAKKAMISGRSDSLYKHVVDSVRAIVFMATPHRGSDLAGTLNRVLSISGQYGKIYVSELMRNSATLRDINDQFKNIKGLTLASFYENRPTSLGFKKEIIVHKDSATLGYDGEITHALDADHNDVIKFESRGHQNYKDVRNLLADFVLRFRILPGAAHIETRGADITKLKMVLGNVDTPTTDLDFFSDRSVEGTGAWLTSNPTFEHWMHSTSATAEVLWLNGVPGTGKSVVTAAVIQHLHDSACDLAYFFFRFDEQNRRSSSFFLRSMAMQISSLVPKFKELLIALADDEVSFKESDIRQIWQKLFVTGLGKVALHRPLFWVIDALDEADKPSAVLDHLSSLCALHIPIRIFIASRNVPTISTGIGKLARNYSCSNVSIEEHDADLDTYVRRELEDLKGRPGFREHVTSEILMKASSNFLWSVLVTQQVMQCDTEEEVDRVLKTLPSDLEPLYKRVEINLKRSLAKPKIKLAQHILTWACCSKRALYIEELAVALGGSKASFIDLNDTARKVCGDFVVVDKLERLVMSHHCAREYITKHASSDFLVDVSKGHFVTLGRCLEYLLSPDTKLHADIFDEVPFMIYAATSWPYHLDATGYNLHEGTLDLLDRFFRSDVVLAWIRVLASSDNLRILVQAAKILNSYVDRQHHVDKAVNPLASTRRIEQREMLSRWAVDLVKIVGKFGTHLLRHPRSIHKHVVPFCPANSIIYQSCAPQGQDTLTVLGFSSANWDDNLAKFTVRQASSITCTSTLFAVLTTTGSVNLYDSSTFALLRVLRNEQKILSARFNATGTQVMCCGFIETKVWNVTTGSLLHVIPNRDGIKVIACAFNADDDRLYICCDDRSVRVARLSAEKLEWDIMDWLLVDDIVDAQQYIKSPVRAEFSIDATMLAVSFRACPLLVWKVQPLRFLDRHVRPKDLSKKPEDHYISVDRIDWNSDSGSILGLYHDGTVFTWRPLDSECKELELKRSSRAVSIRCSPLGDIFVTSSVDGTVRVYACSDLALIYQLFCTSQVSDLAISPDSRRVYDLRETYCNVWEPNALIRLSDPDEKGSDMSTTLCESRVGSLNSEASVEMLEPVASLTIGPLSYGYSTGSEEGIVKMFDSMGNMYAETPSEFMSIDHILWSADEQILVTGDAGGRVRAKRVDRAEEGRVRLELLLDTTVKGPINQILVDSSSRYVLIATPASTHVWSLERRSETAHHFSDPAARWATHSTDPDVVLCFAFDSLKLFDWADFQCRLKMPYSDVRSRHMQHSDPETWRRPSVAFPSRLSEDTNVVERVLESCEGTHILLEVSKPSPLNRLKFYQDYLLLHTAQMHDDSITTTRTRPENDEPRTSTNRLLALPLPLELLQRIEQPIGFIPGETLVFFDKEYWVCSSFLGHQGLQGVGLKMKRHFRVPQDWLNAECLRLAVITVEGTILLPRNGEVGVIRGGMREEWSE